MQIAVLKALFQTCLRAFAKPRALPLVPPSLLWGHRLILDHRVPGSCCQYVSNTLECQIWIHVQFLLDCCVTRHFASGRLCLVRDGSVPKCCSLAESRFQAGIKGIFCSECIKCFWEQRACPWGKSACAGWRVPSLQQGFIAC